MLRIVRTQRRRQNHDDERPAEPAAPTERTGAGVRHGPGEAGGRGKAAAGVRAGPGRVLSVDDDPRDAGLPGVVPRKVERENGKGTAATIPPRPGEAYGRIVEGTAHASGTDCGGVSGDGPAGAGRTDVGTGPDRAARIHR